MIIILFVFMFIMFGQNDFMSSGSRNVVWIPNGVIGSSDCPVLPVTDNMI